MAPMRRLLIGSVSALGYPLAILAVAAGITFTAVDVLAESAAPIPRCSAPEIAECAEAGVSCTSCRSGECYCQYRGGGRCSADSGMFDFAPAAARCEAVVHCDDPRLDGCNGKRGGDSCGSDSVCFATGDLFCAERDAGTYTSFPRLRCVKRSFVGDANPVPGLVENPITTPGAMTETSAPNSDDDGGCTAAPGPASGAGGLLAALVLVLRVVRRRGSRRR